MNGKFYVFRTTLVGGLLFLVPIVVLAIVINKALNLARIVIGPLAALIPVETVAGVAVAKLLAIAAIVFFCFVTGLFAKTSLAKKMVDWMETSLLSNLPGYSLIKGMGETMAGVGKENSHEPVLAYIEEAWQIAFLVERIDGGHVAVFVPGAPSPWSGSLFFLTEDRIRTLDIPLAAALNCVRRMGIGASELLRDKL